MRYRNIAYISVLPRFFASRPSAEQTYYCQAEHSEIRTWDRYDPERTFPPKTRGLATVRNHSAG
jgi:hypothetical protein